MKTHGRRDHTGLQFVGLDLGVLGGGQFPFRVLAEPREAPHGLGVGLELAYYLLFFLLAFLFRGTRPLLIFMAVLDVLYFGAAGLARVGADDLRV